MAAVDRDDCKIRHKNLWKAGGIVVLVLVAGIGWAVQASLIACTHSQEVGSKLHGAETEFAKFAGRQEEFNRHTTSTLDRIDSKVDQMWRSDGHKDGG